MARARKKPIPVTVVAGPRGAGKTTLINRLLGEPAFANTAVILNDFGEVALAGTIVETAADGYIALGSGCVCCSVRGALTDSLENLLRDLAVLARAILIEFPQYREYFGIPAIKAGKRILRSQNQLLERYRGTIGMKTGFICSSGYNIVASAKRGGRTLVAVVLGAASSQDRNETAARLLDEGFANWFTGAKPDLATFQSSRSLGTPVDMHDLICGKHPQAGEDEATDETAAGDAVVKSALGPRFVLMDPVPVFTGRADLGPAEAAKARAKLVANMPLPHLRPRTADAAAAYAPDKALESPTAIQASPLKP